MIEVRNLTRCYPESKGKMKTVLNDVSLRFPKQGLVAILGPSGSGKTTLLRLLGLLDEPTSGSILINGEDAAKWSSKQADLFRYDNVGSIFQDYNLIPHLSVKENIALPFYIRKRNDEGRVEELLSRFQLTEIANSLPKEISGGEAQRASVARSIVLGQRIILADEPTAALDEENATIIMDYLKEASKTSLVVLVTHNETVARQYSDYTVALKKGKIIASNLPEIEEKEEVLQKKTCKSRFSSLFRLAINRVVRFRKQYALLGLTSLVGLLAVNLSTSLNIGIDSMLKKIETEVFQSNPISIDRLYLDLMNSSWKNGDNTYYNDDLIRPLPKEAITYHVNSISQDYVDYIEAGIDPSSIAYFYGGSHPVLTLNANNAPTVYFSSGGENLSDFLSSGSTDPLMGAIRPMELSKNDFLGRFEAVEGRYPERSNEAYLLLTRSSNVDDSVATVLGQGKEPFSFSAALNRKFRFLTNDDYYVKLSSGKKAQGKFLKESAVLAQEGKKADAIMPMFNEIATAKDSGDLDRARALASEIATYFEPTETEHNLSYFSAVRTESALRTLYDEPSENDVTIVGIFRPRRSTILSDVKNGIYFPRELTERLLEANMASALAQEVRYHLSYNPISTFSMPTVYDFIDSATEAGTSIADAATALYNYFENRTKYGCEKTISSIKITPKNFDTAGKNRVYLKAYNENKPLERQIYFNDLANIYGDLIKTYSNIFYGLMFVICAIVIVTCGLTTLLTARLEVEKRRREISIFRSIGASKFFVASVFLVEHSFIGLFAGVFGALLAYVLLPGINAMLCKMIEGMYVETVALLPWWAALIVIGVGILVSLLASFLPALLASLKPPSEHLKEQ